VNLFYFQIKRTHTTGKRRQRGVEGVELLPAKPEEVLSPLIAISPESGYEDTPDDFIGDLERDMILARIKTAAGKVHLESCEPPRPCTC
jgi:hypothetical protein